MRCSRFDQLQNTIRLDWGAMDAWFEEDEEVFSHCPYKGPAHYWSLSLGETIVQDVAWSYRTPLPESQKIAGLVCSYPEKVDLYLDRRLQD